MAEVTIYTAQGCGFCRSAENLLRNSGVANPRRIYVDREPAELDRMIAATGRRTVPQIFIGTHHVGGFDDLSALDRAGRLDAMLR